MQNGKIKFKAMVENYPDIACYWNFDDWSVKIKSSEGLPLTGGELVMCDFFLSVWYERGDKFDLIRAARVLSNDNKRVITDWFMNPYAP